MKKETSPLAASNFCAVIKRKKKIHPNSILSKSTKPSPKQCIWGNENKIKAVDQYYFEGCRVTVCAQVSFVANPVQPWLGTSPDFLTGYSKEASQYGILVK